jgi:hypothetical protein
MGGDEMSYSALPYIRSIRYTPTVCFSPSLSHHLSDDDDNDDMLLFVFANTYYRLFTDLYPVGHWVNQTGVIVVRYLPAISPTEATSRDDMMRLVSDEEGDDDAAADDDDHDILFDRNEYGR